jgi:topoiosmerase IV subunit B
VTEFEQDTITQRTHIVGHTTKRGTKVQFWPDPLIFKKAKFSSDIVKEKLRESSFLIPNLKIHFYSEITNERVIFEAEEGIKEYIKFIGEGTTFLTSVFHAKGMSHKIEIDIALVYTDNYNESIFSFVNNVKTRDGGTHETAFKSALTKTINDFAAKNNILKNKATFDGNDIREGLIAIISLKIPESILEFVGQTKDKLGTPEAREAVEEFFSEQFSFYLNENKKEADLILTKIKKAYDARIAARNARNEVRKVKTKLEGKKILSGKLTPAQSKDPKARELFLVEGDSAGGSAKMGRDRITQAILPLRGKVINTAKAKLVDILGNEEIATIINTIGAGIQSNFNVEKSQYGKVIIMTDADTDGAHIQVLLLTFFYRYMRQMIEKGMVYIALPPLYKVTVKSAKNKDIYV